MRLRASLMMGVVLIAVASLVSAALPAGHADAAGTRRDALDRGLAVGPDLTPLGRTQPGEPVEITLLLVQPGAAALQQYVAEQRRATSPIWLTATEVGERYGISADRLETLVAQLGVAGVVVTERFDQRTALVARGSARSVERLFGVQLHDYRTPDGTRVRVPTGEPEIPSDLADAVAGVEGLDTRPAYVPRTVPQQTSDRQGGWLRPDQLTALYGAKGLQDSGIDGSGETVAVASLATSHGQEFKKWADRFHLKTEPTEERVVQPPAPKPGQKKWSAGAAAEVDLDLEMVRAMAPRATVLNYTTKNDGAGLERIVNQVAQDHRASILTISWGSCETAYTPARLQQMEATYTSAAGMGIDIFSASGDFGPYDCNTWDDMSDRHVVVDYPPSSASVIAVGGTTLFFQNNKAFEEGWQEPTSIIGSGGGASTRVRRPAWQLNSVVADTGNAKLVPDVAGPASAFSNLLIAEWGSKGVVFQPGNGTSAASPFWAGATALVKQYIRQRVGRNPDGTVATVLYTIGSRPTMYAAAFVDEISGGNAVYRASPGWDYVTGLGSPNITQLALQWQALLKSG